MTGFATNFDLSRDAFGRLVLTTAAGEIHEGVVPVRAFPLAAPNEDISLVSAEGHEVAWIPRLDALTPELRALVEEGLIAREFMPEILRLKSVSTFATPSTWTVETDRGDTEFILRGEEDIRRIPPSGLLIADSHGIQYLVRDLRRLDRASRRLLDRFL